MNKYKKALTAPFRPWGLPWWLAAAICAVVLVCMFTGTLSSDMAGSIALMLVIGMICNEIGERIPIINDYIGGGLVVTYLISAALFTYKLIPEKYVSGMSLLIDDMNFLTLFIIVLIVGSLLALDRNLLIRSFAGYIPAILGGLLGAGILGIIGGLLLGISPSRILMMYVLPIMGGGNGAGAVPLSQIYEQATGLPKESYYTFAITILTIANIFAIISAAVLKGIGNTRTELTGGNGENARLMREGNFDANSKKLMKAELADIGGALLLGTMFYALGRFFASKVLPTIFGAPIHAIAYMIIFVCIAAAAGIIPDNIRAGAKRLQDFFVRNFSLIIMVGVAIDTDLNELIAAISFSNVVIALLIVLGAIIGSGFVGHLVGFFPIDSAITAGLCMANRGGSGDLAVLGAADRMSLISYAQLSSRLGGGIVLIIAGILFGTLA